MQQTWRIIFKSQINASKKHVLLIREAWQQVQIFIRLSSYAWGRDLERSHLGVENMMFRQLGLRGRFCDKKRCRQLLCGCSFYLTRWWIICMLQFQNKWLWKKEHDQGSKHRAMSAVVMGRSALLQCKFLIHFYPIGTPWLVLVDRLRCIFWLHFGWS